MKWIVFNLMLMISMGISAQRITRQLIMCHSLLR